MLDGPTRGASGLTAARSSGERTRTPNYRARTCRVADYTTPEWGGVIVTGPALRARPATASPWGFYSPNPCVLSKPTTLPSPTATAWNHTCLTSVMRPGLDAETGDTCASRPSAEERPLSQKT